MKHKILALLSALTFGLVGADAKPRVLTGFTGYYDRSYIGKKMANGQPYDPRKLTMACNDIPLGSHVYVSYLTPAGTRRGVHCVVTDHGPAEYLRRTGRIFDLSWAAFNQLASPRLGVLAIEVTVLDGPSVTR